MPTYRPGDNLYTDSVISWNPDDGKMNWYFQFTPGDHWDYDEEGTHILIDGQINGETRQLITHSARNGFLYTMERSNGQTVLAKPYLDNVNWTKGIDQKTGKPVDYVPGNDIQMYAGRRHADAGGAHQENVSVAVRRQQFLAVGLQPEDQAALRAGADRLRRGHAGSEAEQQGRRDARRPACQHRTSATRPTSRRSIRSPARSRPRRTFPTRTTAARWRPRAAWCSRASRTAPSMAFDDTTMQPLWKINVGVGFDAPPMTFEVNGKQYVAILSGLSRIAMGKHVNSPGAQGAAQPDHAVRVRAVGGAGCVGAALVAALMPHLTIPQVRDGRVPTVASPPLPLAWARAIWRLPAISSC